MNNDYKFPESKEEMMKYIAENNSEENMKYINFCSKHAGWDEKSLKIYGLQRFFEIYEIRKKRNDKEDKALETFVNYFFENI